MLMKLKYNLYVLAIYHFYCKAMHHYYVIIVSKRAVSRYLIE